MQKGIDFKETLEKRAFLNKNLKKKKNTLQWICYL